MTAHSAPRPPRFLAGTTRTPHERPANFGELTVVPREDDRVIEESHAALPVRPELPSPPPRVPAGADTLAATVAPQLTAPMPAPAETVPVPAPAATVPSAADAEKTASRLAAALENLRTQTERLAEQARADALEIGFQVARRILTTELTTSPQPLFALVRSAVQRSGESRHLVVRLSPTDLSRIDAAGGLSAVGLAVAQLELRADPSLSVGDCVVEADFGSVDGRLSTRLDALRRVVAKAIEGDPT